MRALRRYQRYAEEHRLVSIATTMLALGVVLVLLGLGLCYAAYSAQPWCVDLVTELIRETTP